LTPHPRFGGEGRRGEGRRRGGKEEKKKKREEGDRVPCHIPISLCLLFGSRKLTDASPGMRRQPSEKRRGGEKEKERGRREGKKKETRR